MITYEEAKKILKDNNQEQILMFFNELNVYEQEKLLGQIENLDFSVLDLVKNKNINTQKGVIEPLLETTTLEDIKNNKEKYEEAGLKAIRNCQVGAVLLAGGQGTRLGSDKPKGMYNIGINKPLYIFEMQIRNLLDVVKKAGCYIPLLIMTSGKNDKDTRNFFEEHKYFGYDEKFIFFFKQNMAPACDYNGKLYLENKDSLALSPNGNGGWYASLKTSGVLDKAKALGVKWLNVYAVDNVLQKMVDPCFVGATILSDFPVSSKVVKKACPDEKVGVLCREDKRPSIVEYYELTKEMMDAKTPKGDYAYNYGVILNYLFRIKELDDIVSKNLPLHIVEKKIPYIDENGNTIKPSSPNGYKFETLVLDMIHMLDDCLAYEVEREKEFAPIKNKEGVDSVESARKLLLKNGVEI